MKKITYILLAAAVAFISCAKEIAIEEPQNVEPQKEVKTITFNASVQLNAETKAALNGLQINWSSGDYVGVATDNDATIRAYAVTPDSSDPTKCTITVNEVEDAKAYYVLFKGSLSADVDANKVSADDFSSITFNKTTKTFSGLKVGTQEVEEGTLNSHIWYEKGYPLSLAGKVEGSTLVLKPCLALMKVQIHSDSVPADHYIVSETYNNPLYNVDHSHSYSAVRGFLFSQKGSSTIYSCGDYDVQISDANDLTVTATGTQKVEERELSRETKLTANTPYYMCVIPGGTVTSLRFRFWGYENDSGTKSWTPVYVMNLAKSMNVAPGDFYDLGTLNPLGRKQAKNHEEDDLADAAASIVDNINNVDWTSSSVSTCQIGSVTSYAQMKEMKAIADKNFVYVRMMVPVDDFDADYLDFFFADDGTNEVYWPWTTKCTNKYNIEHAGKVTSNSLTIKYGSLDVNTKVETESQNIYLYMSIPRVGNALTTSSGTVYFGVRLWKGWTMVGLLPANGSAMLPVALPN